MSTTSFKTTSLQTLKGAFETQPSRKHRRDFLRENKLHLLELQRSTTKKQQNDELKVQKQQKALGNRRSMSLCRSDLCSSQPTPARGSAFKRNVCDKKIQTEDITDEAFLYEALTRLPKGIERLSSREFVASCGGRGDDFGYFDKSNGSAFAESEALNLYSPRTPQGQVSDDLSPGVDNFGLVHEDGAQVLSARNRQAVCSKQLIPPQQTKSSVASKKCMGSTYKLGARDDIRLPKYLEREKREKEEKLQRDLAKDLNCPPGHYLLTENERLEQLNQAQIKHQSLLNDLNRLPMTAETLRVRNRRREIENELNALDANIRIFSKAKVYVQCEN